LRKNLTKDNFVGSGSIDVSSKDRARKTARPTAENLIGPADFLEPQIDGGQLRKEDGSRVCGAMTEQYGQGGRGNESVPQKFVRLVGCHDRSARIESEVRPRPVPGKR
jgi:hypothetical protein